jgi:hypothetical protein
MDDPTRGLRRSKRHAVRALKGHAGVLVTLMVALWVVSRVVAIPAWLIVSLLALASAPLLIDAANVLCVGRNDARK